MGTRNIIGTDHFPLLKRFEAQTSAITLIQRFVSAANLNIHLHCPIFDGVYRIQNGVPEFHSVRPPTAEQVQILLGQIITRIMKALTRHGALIEEEGMTCLAEMETDAALAPLQLAACIYRVALGNRAGQKVLTRLKTAPTQNTHRISGFIYIFHPNEKGVYFSYTQTLKRFEERHLLIRISVVDC